MESEVRSRVRELTNNDLLEVSSDPFSDVDVFSLDEPPRKRTKMSGPDFELIGIKRGASSFKVDPIIDKNKREGRLPREDGREWPEDLEEGDEGGYFESEWRTEEEFRRELLENDPDYKFLILVAGASNTGVEQLYEESDISSAFRRERALISQQKIAIEQVRTSIKELEEDIKTLDREITLLTENNRTLVSDRLVTDSLISRFSLNAIGYDQNRENYVHLLRQDKVLKRYKQVSTKMSDNFKELTTTILAEAEYQIIRSDKRVAEGIEIEEEEKQLLETLRGKKQDAIEDSLKLWELLKHLTYFWLYIGDIENYHQWLVSSEVDKESIIDNYIDEVLDSDEIETSKSELDASRIEVLKVFSESLIFFFSRAILVIVPEDIGTVVRTGTVIQNINEFPFQEARVQRLFLKYGGLLFRTKKDPKIDIKDFYTSAFKIEADEFNKRISEDEDFNKEMHRLYLGPFVTELKIYREQLKVHIVETEKRIDELGTSRDNERDRLSGLRAGTISFKDIEQPYRHRREWVEDPKQSGVVKIKPIVINGMDSAFNLIKRYTAYGYFIDLESLQYGELIQGDFARLVATQMGKSSLIFPKQYLQRNVESMTKKLEFNTMQTLKKNYNFRKNLKGGSPKYIAMLKDLGINNCQQSNYC